MGRQRWLADLRGSPALGGLALLTGCGAPISNDVLAAEGAFLAALPSSARLAPPIDLVAAPDGPDPVLAASRAAAERYAGLVELPVAFGEAVAGSPPDERTEVARRWEPLEVAVVVAGDALGLQGTVTSWLRAEVLKIDDGAYAWTLEAAATREGPFVLLGEGTADGADFELAWRLDETSALLGGDADEGVLDARGSDVDPDSGEPRSVAATTGSGPLPEPWELVGLDGLGFQSALAITDDGGSWPARLQVFHAADAGGLAGGAVLRGTDELAFTACWDAAGTTTGRTGDAGVVPTGAGCEAQRGRATANVQPGPVASWWTPTPSVARWLDQ